MLVGYRSGGIKYARYFFLCPLQKLNLLLFLPMNGVYAESNPTSTHCLYCLEKNFDHVVSRRITWVRSQSRAQFYDKTRIIKIYFLSLGFLTSAQWITEWNFIIRNILTHENVKSYLICCLSYKISKKGIKATRANPASWS